MKLEDVVRRAEEIFWELPEVIPPSDESPGWGCRSDTEASDQAVGELTLDELFEVLRELAEHDHKLPGAPESSTFHEALRDLVYIEVLASFKDREDIQDETDRCEELCDEAHRIADGRPLPR